MNGKSLSTIVLAVCLCAAGNAQKVAVPAPAGEAQSAAAEPSTAPATNADRTRARTASERILRAPEFRRIRQPGLQESVSDRLTNWLLNVARKLLGHTPDLSVFSTIFVWGVVLLAVAALALWLWRATRSSLQTVIPQSGVTLQKVSDIPWQEWLQHAKDAAGSGDFRGAIHFAYWASISSMEQRGEWKPDRARTPREYLRLVSANHQPSLKWLTHELERTWYAQQSATESDFRNCLTEVERLGCR